MPAPTHAQDGRDGLKPFTSVADVLSSIPENAPNHDVQSVTYAGEQRKSSYNAHRILPRAITTHGGQNYHPSGRRDFTLAEYAALQGFPASHEFTGPSLKKQIGNSVPPSIAKVLFESIKKDLEKVDGIEEGPELIE